MSHSWVNYNIPSNMERYLKIISWYVQVEKGDVKEAIRLLEVALQQSATDHSTGKLATLCMLTHLLCNKSHYVKCKKFLKWHIRVFLNKWLTSYIILRGKIGCFMLFHNFFKTYTCYPF